MDFRLKVFQSVARNQSFSRAAKEMLISQPAVTKHIQELESQYKVRLFERTIGTHIRITPEGELLLSHADRIVEAFRQLDYEMNLLTARFTGELRIGASSTISQYVLPPVLAAFLKKFPELKLTVLSGNTAQIEKALLDKKIDLGIIEGQSRNPNLRYSLYMKDVLVAITSVKSILAQHDEVTLDELRHLPLVLREHGSGTLEVFDEELKKHHLKLSDMSVLMQLGSTESIKLFLENSDSIGIVSIRSVNKDIFNGRFKVIEIKDFDIFRTFQFIELQGKSGGVIEDFIRFVRRQSL
ncbi:LysR family transcriptional regulator [Parabacteroides sp. FAFU027]|uniref:LysR family transcriptional regulator n=1 Tax=Parabacteroides sp. FAFU027 TaxID=2922715 RepID=UPI001FAFEEC6|nr:LysR family transcriptional regulator [Parabacteroides sp. FAFU027]